MCRKKIFKLYILLFIIVLIVSSILGCGTNNSINNTTSKDGSTGNYGSVGNSETNSIVGYKETKVLSDTAKLEAPVIAKQKSVASQNSSNTASLNRMVVTTGSMEIRTNKFDKAINGIMQISQQTGGYIQTSNITGNKAATGDFLENRVGYFVLRIPYSKFQSIMSSIGNLGTVLNKTTNGEDVTFQFYDNEARLKTLRVKEERILEILKKTKDMQDVLAAENELQNTIYEIENLTGTQKKLRNLVEFSTLTISINEVDTSTKLVKKPATLGERISYSFKASIQLLTEILKALIVILVACSPFVIILLIISALAWYLLKGRKKS